MVVSPEAARVCIPQSSWVLNQQSSKILNPKSQVLDKALRTIEERVALRRRLVEQARERRLNSLASHFEAQVNEGEKAAESLRSLLLQRGEN